MKRENASVRHLVSDYGAVFFRFYAMHGLAMFCFVVFRLSLFFMIPLYYAADLSLFTICHYKY